MEAQGGALAAQPTGAQQGEPDHVAEFIDAVARQISADPGGQRQVRFGRGRDGDSADVHTHSDRVIVVPTFYDELWTPYLDKLRPYRAAEGSAQIIPELVAEGERVREEAERRIREWLEEHVEEVRSYVSD